MWLGVGTVVYFLLFSPPCDWETNTGLWREWSLAGGDREEETPTRNQDWLHYRPEPSPGFDLTHVSLDKKVRKITLWDGWRSRRRRKKKRRDETSDSHTLCTFLLSTEFLLVFFIYLFIWDLFLCFTFFSSSFVNMLLLLRARSLSINYWKVTGGWNVEKLSEARTAQNASSTRQVYKIGRKQKYRIIVN